MLKGAKTADGRTDDDALWPTHRVNFGCIDGIEATMTAFSPFDNKDYDNMSLPYAFYEISMANSGDRDAKVSLRFVFPEDVKTWAVASDCTGEKTIRKGGTATARFVVAWYDHTDPELAHYKNLYASPQPIAKRGLEVFPQLKHNAMRLADGMRRSSLPHWLQNQVANTLSAIVINSMYKRDGRVAFAEGQWTCFGTMDQMWLARHIICQAAPFYAWRELEYWARTQMKNGQIHHDMNLMDVGSEREKRSALVAWDDTEHRDYRDIQKWVDLNCGFIISVYEAYRTTGDRESFLRLWPNMKRAADRIKAQVELLGNKEYPLTFDGSENSYDAGGNPDPYNANISAVAYRIMAELSAETGESDKAAEYAEACKTVVKSFADRYIRGRDPMTGKHCENVFSGQELAYHLRLGQMWSQAETDSVISRLNHFYYPCYWGLGYPEGTYDEWTPYLLVHYGGLLLHTGRLDEWMALQKDAYMRQYRDRDFATAFKPCAMSPFEGLYAAKADRLAGTEVKGGIVTSCNNFDYILFANVDFGKGGTSAVAIRVNSKYEGSELEVALNDNSGAAVASCKLPCTGGEWREIEVPVAKIKGTHNVVLRFFGSHPDNLMDIDYIKFK